MSAASGQAAETRPGVIITPVSDPYRRYAMWLLLVVYTLNFLDRQIMNTLAEPIKHDLGLSDTAMGAMTGLLFAVFYTFLGIPIARYAERANRSVIISASLAIWSGFTVACGYAQNFLQLALARIGVGVGEAGCTPSAHSLIIDYTPKEKRSSALAFYSLGTPIGALLGTILGGLIADAYGWRMAFVLCGAPGILIALVSFFTLREPRTILREDLAAKRKGPTLKDALGELWGKKTFWFVAFAASIKALIGYGSAAFIVSFFLRNHAPEIIELNPGIALRPDGSIKDINPVTLPLGIIGGVAGVVGVMLGGWLSDRFGARDLRFNVAMPAIATLLSIPFYIGGLMIPSFFGAMVLLAVPTILNTLWYGPVYATVQGLVRPETRATAAAIILFIINLVGLGLGPLGIGIISDFFRNVMGMSVGDGLRWSLITFYIFGASAFLLFWLARRTIREEMVS